jgi:hypothetical protein
MPTLPSIYTSSTPIPDGQTINVSQISLEAGTWLLIAHGRPVVNGSISFAYPFTLRFNITSLSSTYSNADTYFEFVNLTFQTSITSLPTYSFSVIVQPTITSNYFVTCSPLYGNGSLTTAGNNIQIGTGNKLQAIRIA